MHDGVKLVIGMIATAAAVPVVLVASGTPAYVPSARMAAVARDTAGQRCTPNFIPSNVCYWVVSCRSVAHLSDRPCSADPRPLRATARVNGWNVLHGLQVVPYLRQT